MPQCPYGGWLETEEATINLRETQRLEVVPRYHGQYDFWDLVAVGPDGKGVKIHSGDRDSVERFREALGQLMADPNAPCYVTHSDVQERAAKITY